MPHPKTPLVVTTLDMPEDLQGYHQMQHAGTVKDPVVRIFRIPHNYQQYQQTILSRSFSSFTSNNGKADSTCDRLASPSATLPSSICVRGEKIEGQSKPPRVEVNSKTTRGGSGGGGESKDSKDDDDYHMMNARGETNINFYDFHRTWSIEDYVNEDDDDQEGGANSDEGEAAAASQLNRRGNCRRKSHCSTTSGANLKYDYSLRNGRRVRAPSPKTKQIIRVNVKVANS